MNLSEIEIFLPKYLSSTSKDELYSNLKNYQGKIDARVYTQALNNEKTIFQGDGVKGLPVIFLPFTTINSDIPVIILSNTCDIITDNNRLYENVITYAPLFNLEKYKQFQLTKGISSKIVETHIDDIKNQRITSILYFPQNNIIEDSYIFLDKVNSCRFDNALLASLIDNKVFTLSDFGFYLFLIKISMHFTRVKERIDRFSGVVLPSK